MRTMTTAERNRAIKALLTKAFGKGVRVRGSRGTAYGWLTVHIPYAPRDLEERRELEAKCWELFRSTGLDKEIGSFDSADYGAGREIHLNFERVKDADPLTGFARRHADILEG